MHEGGGGASDLTFGLCEEDGMMRRSTMGGVLLLAAAGLALSALGPQEVEPVVPTAPPHGDQMVAIHYLEIVTRDVDSACALYEALHGLSFGPPDPDLGGARVAEWPDGSLVGIRAPLAEHESPIVRTYLAVDDIERAVKAAEERGATLAYGPTRQGERGTFAIVFEGDVQHGLWQR
jgi:predicted enzyme related to lactoylglutathione lyase